MKNESEIESTDNIPATESWRRRKLDLFVRIFATVVCLILFFANSFVIFKQSISGKTIVFSDFNVAEDKLYFPLIVICNSSSYKTTEGLTSKDEYINNTLDIDEILDSVYLGFLNNYTYLLNDNVLSETLKVWPIFTYYRGLCYGYRYTKKVINQIENFYCRTFSIH